MKAIEALFLFCLIVNGNFAAADLLPGPANSKSPPQVNCLDHGKPMNLDNNQPLQWRDHEPSGFHARAFTSGTVDKVFADKTGHRHFSLKIGPNSGDHVEVIYNESFGPMPLPKIGDSAEACGDYIVATQANGGIAPSPDGALVHWVHKSTSSAHDSGFVMLNGVVYGGQ